MSDTETPTETPSTTLYVSPIADPLMGGKLNARAMKLVKKAATSKNIRRGVPEVLKAIRKGQKGMVLLAADVYPVDVIAHVPAYCEKKGIPYAYVPSRQSLGTACQTKRAASVVLVTEPKDDSTYTKTYEQVHKGVLAINPYL
ncbi:snoRNA-binding protein [Perkinsus olseni]|uniref:H/ACA ribonucleoprotein complex subunit 2 n=1 Tax=Perkinsus olseni TaxID=32597 RepID=A0A7J6U9J9_PEROL|nr:snoRNA-binding protein [Perkinsus olseni]